MTGVRSVYCHMDYSAHMVAVMPFGAYGIHHTGVAHTNLLTANLGFYAVTCNLLYIGDFTAVSGLIWECVTQSRPYRVG